jgi:hypothetical protein
LVALLVLVESLGDASRAVAGEPKIRSVTVIEVQRCVVVASPLQPLHVQDR